MKKLYYLFSGERGIVRTFEFDGIEDALKQANEGGDWSEFDIGCFETSEEGVRNAIAMAFSWSAYAELTEEEYKQFEKVQLGEYEN
jgi:hypothetical protein